jgi:hypothetical protein
MADLTVAFGSDPRCWVLNLDHTGLALSSNIVPRGRLASIQGYGSSSQQRCQQVVVVVVVVVIVVVVYGQACEDVLS